MSIERKNIKQEIPEDKKSLLLILQASAIFFIIAGSAGLLFIDVVKDFFNYDDITAKVFCGAVIFIGIFEFFYFPKMFKRANQQAQNND